MTKRPVQAAPAALPKSNTETCPVAALAQEAASSSSGKTLSITKGFAWPMTPSARTIG